MSKKGLRAVLDDAPAMDVARLIAQTDRADGRDALESLLDEINPADAGEKSAVHWMQIEIALWKYEKAFDFGRDYSFRSSSDTVVKQCAIAADRGGLFDKIHDAARKDVAAETDSARLCVKLSFYTGLLAALDKKPLIDPLCELAQNAKTANADDASLRRLVESLLNADQPARAVKALHNAQSPLGLYMRSAADLKIEDAVVAGSDWRECLAALDAVEDAKKKEAVYTVADLMGDWNDDRAEFLWKKILSMPPLKTVYDANACFHLGQLMEDRHQYTLAADIYEKGMEIASQTSGILIATGPKGTDVTSGDTVIKAKIKRLRSLAASQNSVFRGNSFNSNAGARPAGNQ